MIKRIVLFASGSGTNVENIIRFFRQNPQVEVVNILTNNPKAGVIDRIRPMKIPTIVFDKEQLNSGALSQQLELLNPDLIVLAGFLLKIPLDFTNAFRNKIINIHPSLLPKHGGKGMYGDRVHQSVKDAGDKGSIIFQAKVEVAEEDSISQIAHKVHQLEYKHFPEVIQKILFPKNVG
jgi:phosphoribosylglycinamide formyltransferase-1